MSYERPKPGTLLTQNSELRKDGIWAWTLPAFNVKLPSGSMFNVCPNAGACAGLCYARSGAFLWASVKEAHMRKLMYVLEDLRGWQEAMIQEIGRKRSIPYVRIHDSGDFFSDAYAQAWLAIAASCPQTTFYAYTKEVSRFKELEKLGAIPHSFLWLYSMGGREDHLVDKEVDRHAEVFPDMESLVAAGYSDQSSCDTLCVTLPTTKIGIVANNIPAVRRKMKGQTFGGLQEKQYQRRLPVVSDP